MSNIKAVREIPLTLHDVCNVKELKTLLSNGANVNERNTFEETPLLCALRREVDLQLIKEFLNEGADVNAKDFWGVSPLYCAVARHGQNLQLIKLLLDNGADIKSGKHIVDRFLGHTVTHKQSCAKLLIKYKFLKNFELVKNIQIHNDSNVSRNYYQEYKDIVDLGLKSSCYDYLANFLDSCAIEIHSMQSVCLNDNLTLLHFVSMNSPITVDNDSIKNVIDKIYKELSVNDYPVFKDVIVSRIGRENLLIKITEQLSKQCTRIRSVLNLDVMYCISKYLNDEDLLNLTIAFLYCN